MLHNQQERRKRRDRMTVVIAVPLLLILLWVLVGFQRKAEAHARDFGISLAANIRHQPHYLHDWQPQGITGWTPELISLFAQDPWAGTEVSVSVDRNDPFYRGKTDDPIILTLCHADQAACIHIRMRGNLTGETCHIENFWRSHGNRCEPISSSDQARSLTL